MSEQLPVFVYGTLREGMWNRYVLDNFDYETKQATIQGTLVVDSLPYYFGGGDIDSVVHGELIFFDPIDFEQGLSRLDRLEGHPHHYTRVKKRTTDGTLCYIYEIIPHTNVVKSGDFKKYYLDKRGKV